MAYCVLCQEGHKMNDNCMKDVLCKKCGAMGHLSIRCSKRKPILPTFRGSQPAPFLTPTPAPPSEVHQAYSSSQNRIRFNSVDISDEAPGPNSFIIRHVFDTDSIDCDKNDNPTAESELRSFNGGKRKFSDLEEYNIEVETAEVNTIAREELIEEISKCVTVDEPQANKRPRHQSDPDMDSTGLYSTMDSDAETELDLVIDISSDSEGGKGCQQTIEIRNRPNLNSSKMKNVDIELEPVLEGNQSCLASGVRESDELKQFLSSDANYQLLFVHIETFKSSKSSSTLLTQIGCCSGSSTSDFFCAIAPSGLSKYLSRYKLGGDLLRALHMTEEEDKTFQFRSQFEIVSDPTKKISCVSEKDAIMRLLEFFKGFSNCVLVTVDEDTMAILAKKLRDHEKEAFKEAVVGYTYWRRILKYLYVPSYNEVELEEYYNEISKSDLPNYLSSKDIATILSKSVDEVRCKYWQSGSSNMRHKFICKISKNINEIPSPVRKPYDRKKLIEDLEVYSSFRPSVSTTISAEKREQIILSSDSESENEETTSALEIQKKHSEECETSVNMMFRDKHIKHKSNYSINMRGGAAKAIEAFNKARDARVKARSAANLLDKAAAESVAQPRQPEKMKRTRKARVKVRSAANLSDKAAAESVAQPRQPEKMKRTRKARVKVRSAANLSDKAAAEPVAQPRQPEKMTPTREARSAANLSDKAEAESVAQPRQPGKMKLTREARVKVRSAASLSDKAAAEPVAQPRQPGKMKLTRKARLLARSAANLSDKAEAEPVAQPRQPGKLIQCPVCPAPGTKVKIINMGNHFKKCHKQEKLIKCPSCSRKVALQDFSDHLNTSHADFFLVNKPEASEKIDVIKRSAADHGDLVPAHRSVPRAWSHPLTRQQIFSKRFAPYHQPCYPRFPYFPMQGPRFGPTMTYGRPHFRPPFMPWIPYRPNGYFW